MRVFITTALRRHLYAGLADGLRLGTVATCAGFPDQSALTKQLRQSLSATPLNRERWRRVANLTGYKGGPFLEGRSQ